MSEIVENLLLLCVVVSVAGPAVMLGAGAVIQRRSRHPRRVRSVVWSVCATVAAASLAVLVMNASDTVRATVGILGSAALVAAASICLNTCAPVVAARLPRRVLAIGAHPDDVELACGATLAKFADAGHEVRVLVMSGGSRGGSDVRPREAVRGASFIGAAGVTVLDFPDTGLAEVSNAMVQEIEKSMDRFNPDLVLTHSTNDQHQDHHAVHEAVLRAARRHSSILCFESPSCTRRFDPSVFIDVDGYVEAKVAAVGEHRDQAGKAYMSPDHVRSIVAFRGAQAKRRAAEGFEAVRLLEDVR